MRPRDVHLPSSYLHMRSPIHEADVDRLVTVPNFAVAMVWRRRARFASLKHAGRFASDCEAREATTVKREATRNRAGDCEESEAATVKREAMRNFQFTNIFYLTQFTSSSVGVC